MRTAASFVGTFVVLFALTYFFMAAVDALPEPPEGAAEETPAGEEQSAQVLYAAELPVRVAARSIGLDESVANPESTDIAVLDAALLKGAVRYPTSAQLGQDGTVLIFGHSSGLPVVHNQNFKAFNGIQNLKAGEIVSVYSGAMEYRYAVTGVRLANAEEDVIELPSSGKFLTLVTCNSFGKKTDRYVVMAAFVEAVAL